MTRHTACTARPPLTSQGDAMTDRDTPALLRLPRLVAPIVYGLRALAVRWSDCVHARQMREVRLRELESENAALRELGAVDRAGYEAARAQMSALLEERDALRQQLASGRGAP